MKLVILESPFAGEVQLNTDYARACVLDSLNRGEAPIAGHLLYTQPGILRDGDNREREAGIAATHAWLKGAEAVVVYTDLGKSAGMKEGVALAKAAGVPVEYRKIGLSSGRKRK